MLGTVRQYASYTIGAYAVSGAYIPVEWQGDTLICRKNTAYWNAENVSCESLELMVGAKEKEAYEAFEAGRLEYTEVMPVEQRCIASRENPNYNCTENLQTICVGVSAQSALFSAMTEAEVRRFCKALSLLIDREYMAYMSGRPEAGMAEEKINCQAGRRRGDAWTGRCRRALPSGVAVAAFFGMGTGCGSMPETAGDIALRHLGRSGF